MRCCEDMESISDRMRKPTIEFIWDKYVLQPLRDKEKVRLKELEALQIEMKSLKKND